MTKVNPKIFEHRLGIFASTFRRETAREVAEAVADAGYKTAHWDFAAIGLDTLPKDAAPELFDEVHHAFEAVGVAIPSVSLTLDINHPDTRVHLHNFVQALQLIALIPRLGATVVTFCSGTGTHDDMHQAVSDSDNARHLRVERRNIESLAGVVRHAKIKIGFEPAPDHAIANAALARDFFRLTKPTIAAGVILNVENLLTPQTILEQDQVLDHALNMLAPWIVSARVSDVMAGGSSAASTERITIDCPAMLRQLARLRPIPLILQDVREQDASRARLDMLRWKVEADDRPPLSSLTDMVKPPQDPATARSPWSALRMEDRQREKSLQRHLAGLPEPRYPTLSTADWRVAQASEQANSVSQNNVIDLAAHRRLKRGR